MEEIDKQEVEKIADLANLELTEEEVDSFSRELKSILKYMDKLNELDTEDVEPLSHVHDISNSMKEDDVEEDHDREKFLENAPEKRGPYFQVPKVIKDE